MSFSCTIKAGIKELTTFEWESKPGAIHFGLLGLGPHDHMSTEAPYRVEDFRLVVSDCRYGDRHKDVAQDCFLALQMMAKVNLESLKTEKHCDTCTCSLKEKKPIGWSADVIRVFLEIDPFSITHISGGY